MTNKNYTKDKKIINLKNGTLSVPYPNCISKTKQESFAFEQEYGHENTKPLLFDRKKPQKNLSFNFVTTFLELPRTGPGQQYGFNYFTSNTNSELKHNNFIDDYSCERRKTKKLHGVECVVTNDQKKRTRFERYELKNIVFKALIKSDPDLNTCKKTTIGEKRLCRNPRSVKKTAKMKIFSLPQHLELERCVSMSNEEKRLVHRSKVYCYKLKSLYDARGEFKDFRDHLPLGPRLKFQVIIVKSISMASCSKVRNRCILTGHASCLPGFGLSRISFRKYAGLGLIPGVGKAINK